MLRGGLIVLVPVTRKCPYMDRVVFDVQVHYFNIYNAIILRNIDATLPYTPRKVMAFII